MKNNLCFLKSVCVSTLLSLSLVVDAGAKTFAQNQVISDFDTLYESLIETHYNAYAYVTPEELEEKYHLIRSRLTAPSYSLLETITHFQQLVSALKNGHTEIDFPVASYLDYAEKGGTLFPLDLAFENGKALIRANYSSNPSIPLGAELIEINGKTIDEVLNKIHPQISAERPYFKQVKLEVLSFPRYYWYAFGEQDTFSVTIQSEDGVKQYTLDSIDVFSGFEEKKDEVIRAQKTLRLYDTIAYLNPGHFSGDEDKYRQFIDNSFREVRESKAEKLIIDLRYNGGGNDSFSDYLVAYLADKPFKWNAKFKLRTSPMLKEDTKQHRDLNNPYWRSVIDNEDGVQYEFDFGFYPPVAEDKRYKGNVYVLVNRHSHSQASVTAAQIQDYGWGVIVGEETGDFPTLYASQFQYSLPITGITVKISKGYIVRVNGSEAQQGVMPDIQIRDHLLDEEDEILTGLLQRLAVTINTAISNEAAAQ